MEEDQVFDSEESMTDPISGEPEEAAEEVEASPMMEEPATEAEAAAEEVEAPPMMEEPAIEVEAAELVEEKPPPSRLGRFLRRLLRWAVAVMAIFVLGIGALWVTQVQPLRERNSNLQDQLTSAQAEVEALTSTVDTLRSVEAENESLKAELNAASSRLGILSVLVDVTTAQLGVVQLDPEGVKTALKGTQAKLIDLEGRLSGNEAETVRGLRDRVALVLDEVDGDIFAAERDLEVLANSLLELDRELFSE